MPRPLCSLLLFVATPDEETAVTSEAKTFGIDCDVDEALTKSLRDRGLKDEVWSLGEIGAESVLLIGCSRSRGKVVMGPHGSLGSASKALRYLALTGAQGIVQVGIAFGINPKAQNPCDVLVSSSLAAYDNRDVKPADVPPGYRSDYSALKLEPARDVLVARCLREQSRTRFDFNVHVGVLLSGAARIHCAAFRDELYQTIPHGNDPIIGGEMEGVGLLAGAPQPDDPVWCIVKGISDFADEDRDRVFRENRAAAARNAAKFVLSGLINDAKSYA